MSGYIGKYIVNLKTEQKYGPISRDDEIKVYHPKGFAYKNREGITWKINKTENNFNNKNIFNNENNENLNLSYNSSSQIRTYELYPIVEIPQYDVTYHYVINAVSEKQARKIAQKNSWGGESHVSIKNKIGTRKIKFWTDPTKSECKLLDTSSVRIVSQSSTSS
jgi:hypothetical protein